MSQCTPTFDGIAERLGDFTCRDAPAVIHLRDPFTLSNWTLPVLELMMVVGAALALWWAVRRLRRDGDPTNLVLWGASVVYLLLVEIPLYFPNVFGVEDQVGVVFAHNVFTVQFLFDRLPLYIVALYPAVAMLAFEIVRSLGVFRDRGLIRGAVCVGFVHLCLYEVFDQLGPQLRWWAWNTDNPLNHPMLASVPMTSVVIFAAIGPGVLALAVQWLVGREVQRGRVFRITGVAWRTVAAGALVPVGVGILSIPSSVFGGAHRNTSAQAVVFTVELVAIAVVAIPTLVGQWSRSDPIDARPNGFVRLFGPAYLGVLGVLWLAALPTYLGAAHGLTANGTPVGSAPYALVSFVAAAVLVGSVAMAPRFTTARENVTVVE